MRAVVVYESMYGNTHAVADAIGQGLRPAFEVEVLPVDHAVGEVLDDVALLVVGGPTHVHGMSSVITRENAVKMAAKDPALPDLDPDAPGEGLRTWFHDLPEAVGVKAAAFDTRFDASALLTGSAAHGISRRLRRHGYELASEPMSFLVDRETHLVAGELDRATQWGAALAGSLLAATS